MEDNLIKVTVQHFQGCPNGPKMIENVKNAISGLQDKIDFSEQIIDTPDLAEKHNFRGSPTLLIEGEDIEDMPPPENPDLSCRFYPNGLPSTALIKDTILKFIERK